LRSVDLRTWVAVALSALLTLWFVWTVEWSTLAEAFATVRPWPVVLACCMLLGEFVMRAARWRVLLRTVAPGARVRHLFSATVIGAAANTLLPARAGEIAKPLVAARRTQAAFTSVLVSTLVERVFDLVGLMSVLLLMSLVIPDDSRLSTGDVELVHNLKLYGSVLGIVGLLALVVFFVLATRGENARKLFGLIVSVAPAPLRSKLLELYEAAMAGLGGARDRHALWQAPAWSLAIWLNGAVAIFVLFAAFDLDLPFGAACFTAVAIALTVAVPQAPGFFGVFHVAIEKTLVLWQVDVAPAKAFAIVFWGVSFLPVTLVGLTALWREGLSLRGMWSERSDEP